MVNLLPEEMKRGEKEDKGFSVLKENENEKEDIKMTTPVKDKSPRKKHKSIGFYLKLWDFIFKKRKKKKDEFLSKSSEQKKEKVALKAFGHKIFSKKNKDKNKNKEEKKREEDVSDGFGVSLMPKQTMVISRVVHTRLLFLIIFIFFILVIFFISRLYGDWYFDRLKFQAEHLKREIVLLEAQTIPLLENRDNIITLADKATEVNKVLDNHIYWTNFFDLLESYTVPDVYFGNFSASAGKSINLTATSRNLMYLAQQIVAFNNAPDFIKKVNVSNIQMSPDGASASFNLILVDGIWQK